MATRDALNYLGQKVAEVSEPDGVEWTEQQWAEKLAPFAVPPPSQSDIMNEALQRAVKDSRAIADDIIENFKHANLSYFILNQVPNNLAILMSLHVHHRLRAVEVNIGGIPFTIDVMNLVVSGDLETAYVVLSYMTPDDMTMPYHFLSQERIDILKGLISSRVNIG